MGDVSVRDGIFALWEHRIPNYKFPERAIAAFRAMADYRAWLNRPVQEPPQFEVDRERVKAVFDKARAEGRLGLGDFEARDVMEAYGFRLTRSGLAKTADEAVEMAIQDRLSGGHEDRQPGHPAQERHRRGEARRERCHPGARYLRADHLPGHQVHAGCRHLGHHAFRRWRPRAKRSSSA